MKAKQCLLLILAFVLLTANAFGQDEKNEKVTPENILSRQVMLNLRDVYATEIFGFLMLQEGISGGYADLDSHNFSRTNVDGEFVLRDLLNLIVMQDSRYHWIEEDGLINLLPVDEPKILSTRISKFKATKADVGGVIKELMKTDEVKSVIAELNLTFGGVKYPRAMCSGPDEDEDKIDDNEQVDYEILLEDTGIKKISVEFDNLTVRQILNEANRLYGQRSFVWQYWERQVIDSNGKKINAFFIKAY